MVSSSFMGGCEVREASLLVPSSPALLDGEQPRCASLIYINSRPLLTSYCLNFLSHLPLLVEQQCSDSSAESGWYFLAYYAKSWAAATPDSRLVPRLYPKNQVLSSFPSLNSISSSNEEKNPQTVEKIWC